MRLRKSGVVLGSVLLAAGITLIYALPPGEPLEGEIRVNGSTAGFQGNAAIARDADGDYVIVWSGVGSGDASGIFMQRYNRNGLAQGAETRVNSTTADVQRLPAVAMDAAGNYVVAWESNLQDGEGYGIYAQRFGADGSAQGSEFRVNSYATSDQTQAAVAMSAGGAFVVAWRSLQQDGSGQGVYAQRYEAGGAGAGGEFRVNTFTTYSQSSPAVAMQPNGDFMVAWDSNGQEGSGLGQGIYLQRYSAGGVTLGLETRVNTTTPGNQSLPAVAVDGSGGYAIVWQGPDASGLGVYLQRYDLTGVALGSETRLNTETTGDQAEPGVALDAQGRFVASWSGPDASGLGVFLQRTDGVTTALAPETAVNLTTSDIQRRPALATDADGDLVLAWESNLQDGNNYSVIARRFVGPEDVELGLTQSDTPDPQQVNGNIAYRLTVRNNHAAVTPTGVAALDGAIGAATGVVLTDTIPAGTTFVSASGTGWTCSQASGTVTCSLGSALAAGSSSTVTVNVTAGLNGSMLNNAATLAAQQYDSVADNNSATEPTAVCGLGATNTGTLQFSAASYAVNESAAPVTVTVTRTGGSCGVVAVDYTTSDGSARDGVPDTEVQDYSARKGQLVWNAGETASKSFTVAVTDDALNEASETINLALAMPADAERGSLGAQRTALISITDNDAAPSVTLAAATSALAENGGGTELTATLSTASGRDVTVNLAYSGTVTLGDDYTRSATSIVIPAGELSGKASVTAVDDTRDEADETLLVDIASVTNGTESGSQQAALSVVDDDEPPVVQFSAASSTVVEGSTHEVTVQLSAVSGRDVVVNFDISGTAGSGDYTLDTSPAPGLQGGPVTIPANGSGSATITLSITDDSLDEPAEDVVLTLSGATNATLGTELVRTVTLTDNDDPPTIAFTAASQGVSETNSGTTAVTVTARLSALSGKDVTVPFGVSGTAANPQDHDAAAGSFSIPAGSQEASYVFQVANDLLDDADTETIVLSLGEPTNSTLGGTATHTVSVSDNDTAPGMSFTAASQSAAEDVSGGEVLVTVQLSGQSGRDVTVPFSLDGSASQGSDYSITASPLTIPQGSTEATIRVRITNDVASEEDETVVASLAAPADGSASVGATGQHTLTILDNDALPQVSFASDAQEVGENAMLARAFVRLALSRTSSEDATVGYSVAAMSGAGVDSDYRIVSPNPIIIPAGETGADIEVEIINDSSDEASESLILVIDSADFATVQAPSQHALTIVDNDTAVDLSLSGSSMAEAGGVATVTATLTRASAYPVTVDVWFSGPAKRDSDFSASDTHITIPAGELQGTLTLTALQDSVDEADESVTVAMGTIVNGQKGSTQRVTATVVDDDAAPTVDLSLSGSPTAEAGGVATVTATLSAVSARPVTVDLWFGGTATQGSDYNASSSRITIPAGAQSGTLTLTAVQDSADEPNESAIATLGTIVNGTQGASRRVTATIVDDDPAP